MQGRALGKAPDTTQSPKADKWGSHTEHVRHPDLPQRNCKAQARMQEIVCDVSILREMDYPADYLGCGDNEILEWGLC